MASSSAAAADEGAVLAALGALYQRQQLDAAQVQAADAYLRAFQVTPQAFPVAVGLLERGLAAYAPGPRAAETLPVLFFAAQTLANKLRRQHALPADAPSLAEWSRRLARWLAGLPPTMPAVVATQLVLALVACVPRIPEDERRGLLPPQTEPPTAIGVLIQLLTAPVVNGGDASLSAASASPAILAEALMVVAEEAQELQERGLRHEVQRELDHWARPVLETILPQLLQTLLAPPTTTTTTTTGATPALVLRAARAWIRAARIDAATVVGTPLVRSIGQFLRHEELFEVAVDLVIDLVRAFTDGTRDAPLIHWLVPELLGHRGDLARAAADEDTDTCLGLCRVFTELGESYIHLLLTGDREPETALVDVLLDCLRHPEADVADVTMPFWFRLLETLHDLKPSPVLARLEPQVLALANICMHKLQFDEAFPRWPSDKRQDFKSFRQDLGDILRECCDVFGVAAILGHCVQGLEAIYRLPEPQRRWEAVEAHLYCIRSIGRNVEKAEPAVVSPSVQAIFQFLPQFAQHPSIKYTACLIISRYALWLRANPAHLGPLTEFLHQCIVDSAQDPLAADWQVSSAAATALRSLAIDCWSALGSEIIRFYLYVEKHDVMTVEDQVLILEGICSGVARSGDLTTIYAVLDQVMEPLANRLVGVFTASATSERVNSTPAMQEMLRLISIYDHLDVDVRKLPQDPTCPTRPHPLVMLTERIWPAFDQMLTLFRSKDDVVERVCRCYKRMLRTCGAAFKPFLPRMVENLLSFFQAEPKSSYIYAGSMVLKHFYQEQHPDVVQLLTQMLQTFANATIPLFKTTETMQNHPDIIEEFFYLMERGVRCLPQAVMAVSDQDGSTMLLSTLLHCAVMALQVSHNDANKGTLCFLELVVSKSVESRAPEPVSVLMETCVRENFASGGYELIDKLLNGIVLGTIPRYRVDEDFGSIAGVLVQVAKLSGPQLQEWVAQWFVQAQESHAVTFLATNEVENFQRDLFSAGDEREFRRYVRHFARLCASRTEADIVERR